MSELAPHPPTSSEPLQPTRNPDVTLADLITVLLDKGTYLNIDLIISVADIPLIGVNLRATIAGMETMLEYGMMRDWDEKTRAWVRKSIARHFPLAEGEEIVAKMAGGHYQQDFSNTWRPGGLYLTNQRLVVFRRDPKEVLWETDLAHISALRLHDERTIGSETRTRLLVDTVDDTTTMLSAAAPQRVRELIAQARPMVKLPSAASQPSTDTKSSTHAWYLETRAGGDTWRGGALTVEDQRLLWQAPLDARPAVNLPWHQLTDIELVERKAPSGHNMVLHLVAENASVYLAISQPERWLKFFQSKIPQHIETKEGSDA